MPVSRDDVIAAYEMILGRSPESEEMTVRHAAAHADRMSLGLSILASEEAKRRVELSIEPGLLFARTGLRPADLSLLTAFLPAERSPLPGFLVDFLGLRTRTAFIEHGSMLGGTLGGLPVPGDFHADTSEWVSFIRAMTLSHGSFVAAELGAGWGPWTATAHCLAGRLGFDTVRLYAVEADPVIFRRLQQHLLDNAVPPEVVRLRNAVVAEEPGHRPWAVRDEDSVDYGASAAAGGEDYRGLPTGRVIEVPALALSELLREEPVWDLLHIDLQGSEEGLCRAAMTDLSARVRQVIVATHSKALDAGCFDAFHEAGWRCLCNTAPVVLHEAAAHSLQAMTQTDGMQHWYNPPLMPQG